MRARLFWLLVFGCLFCAPFAHASEPSATDLPTLEGRFTRSPDAQPLIADLAYIDDRDFYVRYTRGGRNYYSGGNWSERIAILRDEEPGVIKGPYLLPLQYQQSVPWSSLPGDVAPIRILDSDQWYALREHLFAAILDRGEKRGVVLHFNVDDYFLYYMENGKFQASVIDDKPGDYEVSRRIAIAEIWPDWTARCGPARFTRSAP